jgi:hypothetical protein
MGQVGYLVTIGIKLATRVMYLILASINFINGLNFNEFLVRTLIHSVPYTSK